MLRVTRELISASKELVNHKKEYVTYILFLIITAIVCAAVFDFLFEFTEELRRNDTLAIDETVTNFIYAYRSETLTTIVIAITRLGGKYTYFILIPVSALVLHFIGKSWRSVIPATVILLSTLALNMAFKFIINRPRPAMDGRLVHVADWSLSYPSGHSMISMALYGFLIYLTITALKPNWLKITLSILLSLLILAIGASRVYLGVHYPSDVIAGFAAGLLWLAMCLAALKTMVFYKNRKDRKSNVVPKEDVI